jgi:nicotinate dehydrogenase subunit B
VSALRSLGAFANVFAIESFMDELAAAAGVDPVAFRLRHLSDPRAKAVIETAARAARWVAAARGTSAAAAANAGSASSVSAAAAGSSAGRSDTGAARGRGFAFARYKNQASYVALIADVAVDRASGEIRVEHVFGAVDAGDVVNPDGLRNQIEGGVVQATSWTIYEAVTFDRERITSVDWRSYPIARFPAAPTVEIEVIERPDDPPVGAGEAAQGPTAAAIANAVFAATGVRLRDLPLTAERVKRALA